MGGGRLRTYNAATRSKVLINNIAEDVFDSGNKLSLFERGRHSRIHLEHTSGLCVDPKTSGAQIAVGRAALTFFFGLLKVSEHFQVLQDAHDTNEGPLHDTHL